MSTLRITNGTVVTLGPANRVLPGHDLLCEDGLITAIVPTGTVTGTFDRTVDGTGRVVMPGFINAHMHFYSTLVRGLGKAAPSKDFDQVLRNLWWRLDKQLTLDDSYYSALVPLIDAVRKGTTTLIDHHASPGAVRGSLPRIAQAVQQVGLRASLCYEVSDRDGPRVAADGIDENVAWIRQAAAMGGNQLKALFGLHASFTVGDDTLEKSVAAARSLGAGFHVHAAEGPSDQRHATLLHGKRVVRRFADAGVLGPKSILAHCIHVDAAEMDLLASTGTAVAHNPQSNMNNAVGVADVPAMMARGVLVGLGTDAMTVNMGEELRAAMWVRHLAAGDPSVGFMETLATLLVNNATIANRYFEPGVGVLQPGFAADVVLLDYAPPTPFDGTTFLGHFAFGLAAAPVDTTICGGRVLMEGKRLLLDLDEAEVAARSRECAVALWERF